MKKLLMLLVVGAVIGMPGCASSPPLVNPPRTAPSAEASPPPRKKSAPIPPQCVRFCAKITECAEESDHADLGELLCNLARCETGDKCSARLDSRGHRYRGAFQFSRRSWRQLCYPVFDRLAMGECRKTKSMHDLCCATACTAEVIAGGGIGNWPTCGRWDRE